MGARGAGERGRGASTTTRRAGSASRASPPSPMPRSCTARATTSRRPATRPASRRCSATSGASAASATSGATRCWPRAPPRRWSRSTCRLGRRGADRAHRGGRRPRHRLRRADAPSTAGPSSPRTGSSTTRSRRLRRPVTALPRVSRYVRAGPASRAPLAAPPGAHAARGVSRLAGEPGHLLPGAVELGRRRAGPGRRRCSARHASIASSSTRSARPSALASVRPTAIAPWFASRQALSVAERRRRRRAPAPRSRRSRTAATRSVSRPGRDERREHVVDRRDLAPGAVENVVANGEWVWTIAGDVGPGREDGDVERQLGARPAAALGRRCRRPSRSRRPRRSARRTPSSTGVMAIRPSSSRDADVARTCRPRAPRARSSRATRTTSPRASRTAWLMPRGSREEPIPEAEQLGPGRLVEVRPEHDRGNGVAERPGDADPIVGRARSTATCSSR